MEQLPLEVRLADYAVFDSFLPGPNGVLLHALQEAATVSSGAVLWLWGSPDTGRTHLLQACVNTADASGYRTAYLPLGPEPEFPAAVLEGMDDLDVLCLDDLDAVVGQDAWERQLFRLFERFRERGARLILTAAQPPLQLRFGLADLASRFSSGAIFKVMPLSDDEKIAALKLRANWRGIDLPDETARFLMARVDRRASQLFALLDRLDRQALVEKKKLTVPFVKSVLETL